MDAMSKNILFKATMGDKDAGRNKGEKEMMEQKDKLWVTEEQGTGGFWGEEWQTTKPFENVLWKANTVEIS